MSTLDRDQLKQMSKELDRPVSTLLALTEICDPYYADMPSRRRDAEWFAEQWHRLGFGTGTHVRRVHYRMVSQSEPIMMPDGSPYENTEKCYNFLALSSRDARYLDLVPIEDFIDQRNNETVVNLQDEDAEDAELCVPEDHQIELPPLPELYLSPPTIPQTYHLEIICEKSTIYDVLN